MQKVYVYCIISLPNRRRDAKAEKQLSMGRIRTEEYLEEYINTSPSPTKRSVIILNQGEDKFVPYFKSIRLYS